MTDTARNRKPYPNEGFILIEVLVALAVLSIGILAVLTGILSSLNLQKDNSLRYRAGLLVQDKLLHLNETPYQGGMSHGVSENGTFQWRITSEPWKAAPAPKKDPRRPKRAKADQARISQVSVEVSWQTRQGQRSVTTSQLVRLSPAEEGEP